MLAGAACSGNDAGGPDNYKFDESAPAARPDGATYQHEAYADCVMKDHDIDNHGYCRTRTYTSG